VGGAKGTGGYYNKVASRPHTQPPHPQVGQSSDEWLALEAAARALPGDAGALLSHAHCIGRGGGGRVQGGATAAAVAAEAAVAAAAAAAAAAEAATESSAKKAARGEGVWVASSEIQPAWMPGLPVAMSAMCAVPPHTSLPPSYNANSSPSPPYHHHHLLFTTRGWAAGGDGSRASRPSDGEFHQMEWL